MPEAMLRDQKSPCAELQRLKAAVQLHLMEISKLTRVACEALTNGNDKLAGQLDRQVDLQFGKKERAMGALYQHRKKHGC